MLNDLLFRLRSLLRRSAVENELDEELRFHLEQQVEKHVRAGFTREEALRRARLEFGGLGQVKEDCRESHGITFLEITVQDVRYALRQLRKTPGIYGNRGSYVGLGNWRQRGDLYPGECRADEEPARCGSQVAAAPRRYERLLRGIRRALMVATTQLSPPTPMNSSRRTPQSLRIWRRCRRGSSIGPSSRVAMGPRKARAR